MTGNTKPTSKKQDRRPPLTDEEGEVRELTAEDFEHFRPMSEFPEIMELWQRAQTNLRKRGQRGPQKAPTKEQVTLRLNREVVESYRAGGPGWQTRINDDLVKLNKRRKHG
jgi:uncharacterized protein (DUF4415 family)